jgi:cold shock CspA family protein
VQTDPQVDFQGFEPSIHLRERVARQVGKLEDRFGRITACRVAVKGPGGHHRSGGLYEVNIHLAMPDGREVAVERTADLDERHGDPMFAINDAFKRARRRLQDHVRRMQGQVKAHGEQPIATVKYVNDAQGFGLLVTSDNREIYFHKNSVLNGGFSKLTAGTRVTFVEEAGVKGPQASTVRLLGKHGMK